MTFVLVRVNKSNDYNVNLHYCNCHQRALGNKTACILSFFLKLKVLFLFKPSVADLYPNISRVPSPLGGDPLRMREETSGSRGRDTHITSDLGTAANGEP